MLRNMFARLCVASFVVLLFTALASIVMGQVIGQPYRLTDREVEKIIHRIEQQSDKFRSALDSALDKSRFNGSTREDDINAFVKDFYRETKHLHDQFDHHKSTAPDVESVLERATRIDSFMNRYPLSPRAQNDWATLKANLDELATAYNVGWRWGINPIGAAVSDGGGVEVSGMPYRISDREVEKVINRIEKQSDRFRSALDAALDKSRFDGTRREDDINAFVKDFYKETKTLHDHFDSHKSTTSDVQTVLDRGAQIDQFMRRNRLKKDAQKDWTALRA